MRRVLYAACVVLWASLAQAQTNPVLAGQAFTVAFDHDGQNVTGYQCVLDGKPLGAVLATTARSCAIPGQAAGAHSIAVEAINAFGRTSSAVLPVTAGTAPTGPTNLRISLMIAVQPTGSAELLAFHVEKVIQ